MTIYIFRTPFTKSVIRKTAQNVLLNTGILRSTHFRSNCGCTLRAAADGRADEESTIESEAIDDLFTNFDELLLDDLLAV